MNKKGHILNGALLALGLAYIRSPLGDQPLAADVETLLVDATLLLPPLVLGALLPDIDTAFGKHRKTLHNLPLLAAFVAYPFFFGNLEFVWIGIATHYVLDVLGSKRGIALFYPFSSKEYGFPIGVRTSSSWSGPMTIAITGFEIAVCALVAAVAISGFDFQLETARQTITALYP
ncbi:metal-dependent hydrolase [Halorubellus sp. JP-L1]|uniref:metal-dependent hydrolase n=1 Tax=Halorubellus sp. JP-L1 TaxID=2715753 RepID=UPI00140B4AEB|nr:metal-dependent hydrolase [Halorubellus sp. JP-L1]NHN42404.1 metal-dependent hydrolase [Halorubellus sp. JP-L1]